MTNFIQDWLVWIGIVACVAQSALFSGLNLAYFSISRLRLVAEAQDNPRARIVLSMRDDSNFLLTTILWGNVATNTLLAILSNSVMTGVLAFAFSTVVITFFGEICPQAYFSRRALQVAARFAPILRFYQRLLYPVAKPSARLLDVWLGNESVEFMRETTLRNVILQHMQSKGGEINDIEGFGALNFMDLDDVMASGEGQPVEACSIVPASAVGETYLVDARSAADQHTLLRHVRDSGTKWMILVDAANQPTLLLNAESLLRDLYFSNGEVNLLAHCHEPLIFDNCATPLGDVIALIKHRHSEADGESILNDVALIWSASNRRVITGSDILGQLLRGVTKSTAELPDSIEPST